MELQKLYEIIMDRFNLVSFDSKFHFIKFASYFTENITYLAGKVVDLVSWSMPDAGNYCIKAKCYSLIIRNSMNGEFPC